MKYCNRCGAPHEPGRCGRDSADLRTRVAAVVSAELCRQQHAIDPHRVWQWFDMGPVADAVIRELALTQQYLVDGIISDGEPRPWEVPCETRYATEWEPFHG